MTQSDPSALHLEWRTLQHDHEGHEKVAFACKLLAVVLTAQFTFFALPLVLTVPLLLCVWVVEAMVRTVQGRLGARIVRLEQLIADGAPDSAAGQLHSEWLAGRSGALRLLREYGASALKPTVIFPYPVLLVLLAWLAMPA
jgi:hypothetical protein